MGVAGHTETQFDLPNSSGHDEEVAHPEKHLRFVLRAVVQLQVESWRKKAAESFPHSSECVDESDQVDVRSMAIVWIDEAEIVPPVDKASDDAIGKSRQTVEEFGVVEDRRETHFLLVPGILEHTDGTRDKATVPESVRRRNRDECGQAPCRHVGPFVKTIPAERCCLQCLVHLAESTKN